MKNYLSKITAIIVLYNVTDLILKSLENLRNVKIIIADNGDNDQALIDKIKEKKNREAIALRINLKKRKIFQKKNKKKNT